MLVTTAVDTNRQPLQLGWMRKCLLAAFLIALDGLIGFLFGVESFVIATVVLGLACAYVYRAELHSALMAVFRKLRLPLPQGSEGGENHISLSDAVTRAWEIEEIRRLPEFEKLVRDRPQDVLRRLAERIFDGGDPSLSIRGVIGVPPLEQKVETPEEYTFSDDLTEMTHVTGDGRCYRELRVRWSDIERSIRQRTGAQS